MGKRLVLIGIVAVAVVAVITWRRCSPSNVSSGTTGTAQKSQLSKAHGDSQGFSGQRATKQRRIAGLVLADGKPVSGATVTVRWTVTDAGGAQPPTVTTGQDGRFDLGSFAADVYTITAAAQDHSPAIREIDLRNPLLKPPSDNLVLVLKGCETYIIGSVFDASGGAIQGAQVSVERSVGTTTDNKGGYKLCVPTGEMRIRASADGYGSIVFSLNAHGEIRRDLTLVPAASVTGQVINDVDKSSVAGALVSAWPLDKGPMRPGHSMTYADDEGRFTLQSLAPGRFVIFATVGGLNGSVTVFVDAGKTTTITVALQPRTTITGRVVAAAREPVPGVRIVAQSVDRAGGSRAAITQEDGSFLLDEAPIGSVAFEVADHVVDSPKSLVVDAKGQANVEVHVVAQGSISGRVTQKGAGVADAVVFSETSRLRATTGLEGEYTIGGVPPGEYTLQALADSQGTAAPKTIKIAQSQRVQEVNFELDNTSSIAGQVVDQENRPVPDVVVIWTHSVTQKAARATTDNQGRFSVTGLPTTGKYRASILPVEQKKVLTITGGTQEVQITSNSQRVEGVRLQVQLNRLTISGTVVDESGAPVSDARVDALAVPNDGVPVFHTWLRLPSANTGADGEFVLTGLAAGKYRVRARTANGSEAMSNPLDAGTKGAVLKLVTASRIEVTLEGFTSTPTVDAQVVRGPLRAFFGEVSGQTARINGLVPGQYIVTAHNSRESDAAIVSVGREVARVVLRSRGSRRIKGLVKEFTSRQPVANMECLFFPAVEGILGAEAAWQISSAPRTGPDGTFEIDFAPAGSGAIYCYDSTSSASSARAFLTAGNESATIELDSVRLTSPAEGDIGVELDQGLPVTVVSVRDDGPAARAGVRAGDQIVALSGTPVGALSKGAIQYWISNQIVGSTVKITVGSAEKPRVLSVVVGHEVGS